MPTKSRNRRSPKRLARRMKPPRLLSRRKGSGKKGSARARTPKKMRGGVTRRRLSQLTQQELLTALEELPADVVKQIGKRHPLLIPPFTNVTLSRAVETKTRPEYWLDRKTTKKYTKQQRHRRERTPSPR